MASIDDLRPTDDSEVVIDATNTSSLKQSEEKEAAKVVNMSKGKTVVRAKRPAEPKSEERVEFNPTSIPQDPKETEDLHESLAKDILEGANSPFAKYVKEKTEEMNDWVTEKEDEFEIEDEKSDMPTDLDSIAKEAATDDEEVIEIDDEDGETVYNTVDVLDEVEVVEDELEDTEDISVEVDEEPAVDTPVKDNTKVYEFKKEEKNKPEPAPAIKSNIELETDSATTEFDYVDDEEEVEEAKANDDNELLKHLQKIATEKFKPISTRLDISSFTINVKPTTNTKFLQQQQVRSAKWVLPAQESVVHMKQYLGTELEDLREYSADNTSISSLTKKYRSIYDHIVSPKPSTFEAWLKATPYQDIDHYFFAIYIASFKDSNYIPVDCQNRSCNETFLTDDVPIMDMIKFDSNEAKKKFEKIYHDESTMANPKGLYVSEVVPLSYKIAVGFKEPSIYSLMEVASLDDAFKDKYSSIIDLVPYIDTLYLINMDTQSLDPVGYKVYADNAVKTVKSKIQKFDSVLKVLNVDELNPMNAYIRSIAESRSPGFHYIYPQFECPKCKTLSAELEVTAENMVFTRHQLASLVTTTLN